MVWRQKTSCALNLGSSSLSDHPPAVCGRMVLRSRAVLTLIRKRFVRLNSYRCSTVEVISGLQTLRRPNPAFTIRITLSYRLRRNTQLENFNSRTASPAPLRFANRISEYLRERMIPGAPARNAACTAAFTL